MSDRLREVLIQQLPRLYRLAFFTTGSHEAALARFQGFGSRHGSALVDHPEAAVELFARDLEAFFEAEESVTSIPMDGAFQALDEILRDGEISIPVTRDTPGIDGELERIPGLHLELKRTCLARSLVCLTVNRRLAFALVHVLGLPVETAAAVLKTSVAAFRVRLVRATKTLSSHLDPLCGHLHSSNPCQCDGRLFHALERGFIGPARLKSLPIVADEPRVGRMEALYPKLPASLLPEEVEGVLLRMEEPTRPETLDPRTPKYDEARAHLRSRVHAWSALRAERATVESGDVQAVSKATGLPRPLVLGLLKEVLAESGLLQEPALEFNPNYVSESSAPLT